LSSRENKKAKRVKETYSKGGNMNEEQKKSFLEKMSEELLKWDTQIDELKVKAGKVAGNAKEEYHKKIDELQKKKEELKTKVQEAKQSGGEAWKSIASGIETAVHDLKKGFSDAFSQFKE
jgi:DNA mismatch repair ATPase MutS